MPLGISKAAIYHHYSSKDEILLDLVGPLLQATDDLLARAGGTQQRPAPDRLLDDTCGSCSTTAPASSWSYRTCRCSITPSSGSADGSS